MTPAARDRAVHIATIVATLAAVFGIGYALGKDTNEGTISVLRERGSTSERTEASLRSEITSLRLELQTARESGKEPSALGKAEGRVLQEPAKPAASTATSPKRIELAAKAGTTAQAFDGSLSVSLLGTKYALSPGRYQAVFAIGGLGKEAKTFDGVDVGFATNYSGFSVRLLSVGSDLATFEVSVP